MSIPELVRKALSDAGLSIEELAEAANVPVETLTQIERGTLSPSVDTIRKIAQAAGMRLHVEPHLDYAVSITGLARSIRDDIEQGDFSWPVRKAAELAQRFHNSDAETRHRMIAAEPPLLGDPRWDAFLAALTEWIAVKEQFPTPSWVWKKHRYLDRAWWITSMKSMHVWEFAGSPVSFQIRGVYIHRESLTNI